MQEALLYYIWQFQDFDRSSLSTRDGRAVCVIHPGYRNTDAGPDFFNARIRIGDVDWVGNVEIHVHERSWFEHGHDTDPAYSNVILHVVWVAGHQEVSHSNSFVMPVVELKPRVSNDLLSRYEELMANRSAIRCEPKLPGVSSPARQAMMDKAAIGRLEDKASRFIDYLTFTGGDWEEAAYVWMVRGFGFGVNAEPMQRLAEMLPFKIILKQRGELLQVEALLFGQAGMLEEPLDDEYWKLLRREYDALSAKYSLKSSRLEPWFWKFARLRPANFPTLRLAQLSALLFHARSLVSHFIEAETNEQLRSFFQATPSAYWGCHYHFQKTTRIRGASLGKTSVDSLIVNAVAPLLAAYGRLRDCPELVERAAHFLQQIPAEKNRITEHWLRLGIEPRSAFESQGLLHLYRTFCSQRRCLLCAIGVHILQH